MIILGIETSCDDTSLAIIEINDNERIDYKRVSTTNILGSLVSSQAANFANYGGVIPELSARGHAEQIFELFDLLLQKIVNDTNYTREQLLNNIDKIAVTTTPGLISALRVGQEFAKVIHYYLNNHPSIISVNHLHGHRTVAFLNDINYDPYPHLHLLVSGGNTQICEMNNLQLTDNIIIGDKLDDAAGECMDKIGRMLGLVYPGGIMMSRISGLKSTNTLKLPISMSNIDGYDYSFSGVKTAMRNKIMNEVLMKNEYEKVLNSNDLEYLLSNNTNDPKLNWIREACISTQYVVVKQLINRFSKALKIKEYKSIGLSGGVSANPLLRQMFEEIHPKVLITEKQYTGDNAVMIALAGGIMSEN
jgi:N6-L-threonylcarbamoyladenine synthase